VGSDVTDGLNVFVGSNVEDGGNVIVGKNAGGKVIRVVVGVFVGAMGETGTGGPVTGGTVGLVVVGALVGGSGPGWGPGQQF